MTDKVQLIRAEIEKKIKVLSPFTLQGSDTCGKVIRQLESLVSFIDSLPEEPVSEELEEVANKYGKETFVNECMENGVCDKYDLADAFKAGANWQKEQMMANATKVTVHIDAGGYPYTPEIELYDYDKDVPLAKEGDKYKVVLIKEN